MMGAAALVFGVTFVHAVFYNPPQEIPPPPTVAFEAAQIASSTPPGEYPARITIPALQIDAAIQERGIVAGNRMAAPTNFTDAAWFKYGVLPGMAGTAVLYGHLDNGLGLDGVFKNLGQLKIGDQIQIQTKDGRQLPFTVSDIETYPYQSVPPEALGEGDQPQDARISLITCSGSLVHDPAEGFTYDHRLVVFATYAGQTL